MVLLRRHSVRHHDLHPLSVAVQVIFTCVITRAARFKVSCLTFQGGGENIGYPLGACPSID